MTIASRWQGLITGKCGRCCKSQVRSRDFKILSSLGLTQDSVLQESWTVRKRKTMRKVRPQRLRCWYRNCNRTLSLHIHQTVGCKGKAPQRSTPLKGENAEELKGPVVNDDGQKMQQLLRKPVPLAVPLVARRAKGRSSAGGTNASW
eukprot:g47743.t1